MSQNAADMSTVSDNPEGKERKRATLKRPLHFWKPFNDWWREKLSTAGSRPTSSDITCWYRQNCAAVWPRCPPTIQETRSHAKCMRTVDDVRKYFREYRARQKGPCNKRQRNSGESGSKSSSCSGMSEDASDDDIDPELLELFQSQHTATNDKPAAVVNLVPESHLINYGLQTVQSSSSSNPNAGSPLASSSSIPHVHQQSASYFQGSSSASQNEFLGNDVLTSLVQEDYSTMDHILGAQTTVGFPNIGNRAIMLPEPTVKNSFAAPGLSLPDFSSRFPEDKLPPFCKAEPGLESFPLETAQAAAMLLPNTSSWMQHVANPGTCQPPLMSMQFPGSNQHTVASQYQDVFRAPQISSAAFTACNLPQDTCTLMAQAMALDYRRVLMNQMQSQELMIQGAIAEIGRFLSKQ